MNCLLDHPDKYRTQLPADSLSGGCAVESDLNCPADRAITQSRFPNLSGRVHAGPSS
jgi:hypothetical protein